MLHEIMLKSIDFVNYIKENDYLDVFVELFEENL